MDQYSGNTATSSSPPPLFYDSVPFLLPFDPSPLIPPSSAPPRNSKKRSRASRRAPTTVLTTDTSNFRAMVQEFTGIPSPPFSLPPRVIPPFSHNTLPLPPLSSNSFLQSLINTHPILPSKPPYPSPPAFSMAGRDQELQQSRQGDTMLDSWICSSDYK